MYQIYNEDCLEGMKKIPDNSVDMILDDLPYGTTDCSFDKRLPFEPMWEQFLRVTKRNAAIVLFSQMPFGSDLIQSQRKLFRYEIIWEKPVPAGFLNARKMPLRCHENILVYYRALPTYNPQFTKSKPYEKHNLSGAGRRCYSTCRQESSKSYDGQRYPRDVMKCTQPIAQVGNDERAKIHPTQKPTDLLEYLIKTYTNAGEVVLDATMGSGSTGVACVNTGRKFIGFETEQNFYEIAQKRIEAAVAQREQSLFNGGD